MLQKITSSGIAEIGFYVFVLTDPDDLELQSLRLLRPTQTLEFALDQKI